MGTAFLMAGVINLAASLWYVIVTVCWRGQQLDTVDFVTGLLGLVVLILLGRLLIRQHLTTNTNFLERLIVAFRISERKNT